MEIEIKGYSEDRLIETIAEVVKATTSERIEETIETAVREAIAAQLEESLREIVAEKLRPAVEAALADGWRRTNQWGDHVDGQRVGIKERIVELLENGVDRYHSKETRVDNIAKAIIDETFKTEFKAEIDRARAAFAEQVNGLMQAKLRETLASALGLKA